MLGAYGLIGLPVSLKLVDAGHCVTGLGRDVARARISYPQVTWNEQDIAYLTDASAWLPFLSDVDAVVNCAGALQDSPRDNLHALQFEAMKALFEACERVGIKQVVQISAVGVSLESNVTFSHTKAQADAALAASNLPWTILRPGLVLAPNAYGGTALLRGLASFPFAIPLLDGQQRVQTVSIDDVAEAVLAAIEGRVRDRTIYDLVESDTHSLQEVILAFRSWLGHPPAPVVKMPSWFGVLTGRLGDLLSYLGWRSPLRTTAILQLGVGVVGDASTWRKEGGHRLRSLDESLRHLPATVQERWFGRMWLLKPAIIAVLSFFWLASGMIGLVELDSASALLTERGWGREMAMLAVLCGSLIDIVLGAMILVRRFVKAAVSGMIGVTALYLMAATLFTPDIWLDPLGPLIKVIPGAFLALVACALAEER
ncbi:SDR family oxidoreductase [Microvirga flavescens]|uniref:SDR family oxidoreductase n=1 Tax=Microvirga flavescens TaxID=2249811 RepID=UPI001FE21104|nr:SDR family oxidoreductase [Microvirga flavescens]